MLYGEDRVVIVGSPGVGKSCFLMLIAFYLACIKMEKVLVIRRLKKRKRMNAVVFFDGRGSYARLSDLSSQDIKAIRGQAKGATVLVDGFNQEKVEDPDKNYMPFDVLATSCQFDAKQDDSSRIVVLPAWRDADLLQYAKSTNWVTETGLRQIKRQDTPFPRLVKEQYFYSGGSLREFCRNRRSLLERVTSDCCAVANDQAFELVYNYGGGQSRSQVDRIRRHFITDCNREVDYYDRLWWKLSVDSGYVLSQLGRKIDTDKQLEVYKYAKSVGAGFHGVAYEQLLHNAVRGAFVKRKPVVLKMREGSIYEKIEIRVPNVVCSGENEESCYRCLSALEKDTYWYPDYPFFPFIDAVTTCEAFPSKGGSDEEGHNLSTKSETIVAYIQVTIRSEKTFKEKRLCRLNEELDKNTSLKNMKRAFVVVGPDSGICKLFDLKGAPDANTFLTMISCFNPEQLERELS
ncbi:putative P-loop containing nucleoside triphosphate hydrolase [Plasmopara halstedii]